jgi:16S rRNA processing protein RimM
MDKVILIGKVSRLHGFKGELSLKVDPEFVTSVEETDMLFIEIDQKNVPFFIESYRLTSTGFVLIKFEEVDTEAKAIRLRNCPVFLREKDLIVVEQEGDELKRLVKYSVIDSIHGDLGKVAEVVIMPGNNFLIIDREDGEVFIPIHEDIIQEIDDKKLIIKVVTPEGLVELNLEGGG